MEQVAIISIDGHVRANRSMYRGYIDPSVVEDFDAWVRSEEKQVHPDTGNVHPDFDPAVQWDSDARLEVLDTQGVTADVSFPNHLPFRRVRL